MGTVSPYLAASVIERAGFSDDESCDVISNMEKMSTRKLIQYQHSLLIQLNTTTDIINNRVYRAHKAGEVLNVFDMDES